MWSFNYLHLLIQYAVLEKLNNKYIYLQTHERRH